MPKFFLDNTTTVSVQSSMTLPKNVLDIKLNHLIVRLQTRRFGECFCINLHCNYSKGPLCTEVVVPDWVPSTVLIELSECITVLLRMVNIIIRVE